MFRRFDVLMFRRCGVSTFRRFLVVVATLFAAPFHGAAVAEQPEARSLPRSLPNGITPDTQEAIDRGLAYLARTQSRAGSWSSDGGIGRYPVAMTALAGLALLMDGNTTTQGRYAPGVDRATTFLLRSVGKNGLLARADFDPRPMHGHGFAMLFLSQVYGVVSDAARAGEIHEVLTRAIRLTAESQSVRGGWMYTPNSHSDEGSVTVTQVQGLRSCRNVGIAVPKETVDAAMEYLAKSQNSDGGIRYTASRRRGPSRPAITAAAVACWYNAGEYDNPRAARALAFCKDQLKPGVRFPGHDFYAHLYLAQALFVRSGVRPAAGVPPNAKTDWDEYFRARRDYLLARQRKSGSWLGDSVGEVYGTAIALIILQLPHQRLPIMQR